MQATPPEPLHRVSAPLNWDVNTQDPTDGAVEMRDVNGVPTLFVVPSEPPQGVSMFHPTSAEDIIAELNLKAPGPCGVSQPNQQLDSDIRLVNDRSFRLRGRKRTTLIGQHYTLYVIAAMPVAEFERRYEKLLSEGFLPCSIVAGGESSLRTLADPYSMPGDRLSWVAVKALEQLAEKATNPNTAFFATLFALDMRATNAAFVDVCTCGNMAAMVAKALEEYVVQDPEVCAFVEDAQDVLAGTLKGYTPTEIKYEPTVHPMRFIEGCYTASQFASEVQLAAPAFAGDDGLESKVQQLASSLFNELQQGQFTVDMRQGAVRHKGLTFTVICSFDKAKTSPWRMRTPSSPSPAPPPSTV